MKKLKADVTASDTISFYIAPKWSVKKATIDAAGVPGLSTCKSTACQGSAPGRLITFNRCIAVGNFQGKPVTANINAKQTNDGTVAGVITGITIAVVASVVTCVLCILCCLKKIACCCC